MHGGKVPESIRRACEDIATESDPMRIAHALHECLGPGAIARARHEEGRSHDAATRAQRDGDPGRRLRQPDLVITVHTIEKGAHIFLVERLADDPRAAGPCAVGKLDDRRAVDAGKVRDLPQRAVDLAIDVHRTCIAESRREMRQQPVKLQAIGE